MLPKAASLGLEEDGDDFALRRIDVDGTTVLMPLAEQEVITLAQSAIALQQLILSKHSPRLGTVSATDVAQTALSYEVLGEKILLTLISPHGLRSTFALPGHIAQNLAERLPVRLAEMRAAGPQQKQ